MALHPTPAPLRREKRVEIARSRAAALQALPTLLEDLAGLTRLFGQRRRLPFRAASPLDASLVDHWADTGEPAIEVTHSDYPDLRCALWRSTMEDPADGVLPVGAADDVLTVGGADEVSTVGGADKVSPVGAAGDSWVVDEALADGTCRELYRGSDLDEARDALAGLLARCAIRRPAVERRARSA